MGGERFVMKIPHIATVLVVFLFSAGGCGNHAFNADAKSPVQETKHDVNTGPYSSRSNSGTTTTSDYHDCLAELNGFPDKEDYCQRKVWGGRPGQFAPLYYYGGSPYYPY